MDPAARFVDEQRALLIERSRWLLAFGVLFFPLNIPLDFLVAPDIAPQVLVVRLGLVVAFAVFLGTTWTAIGRRFIRAISVSVALLAALGFALCTFLHTGFDSTYVVGMMLVMLGSCFFLPWRLGPAAVFCAVSTGGYLGINLAFHGWSDNGLAWVAFLLGSGSVACLATHLNARGRRQQFDQRLELERAKADLETLGEARTRFFANVSHELRTPLMLILGPLEDLLDDAPDDRVFASMWSNGVRLQRQVEMLLDLARLEVGRLESRPTEADLGDVLAGLVAAARPHAERSGVDLVALNLEDLPRSLLDAEQIETVAGNLLSNALKFTPSGGRVVVEASASAEAMWFEVRDTGVGIPTGELDRIFDRFHRVEGAVAPGTGLGLALTRELVQLNGGRITARSVPGEGSAFRVVLPYRPVTVDVVDARDHAVTVEVQAGSSRLEALLADAGQTQAVEEHARAPADAPHVLLVEDNADLRAFVVRQLSKTYRVSTAPDGVEGLKRIGELSPDVVLCDVMMPRMDGFELCRRVRANPDTVALPFILLTARGELEDLVGGLHLGADDYVTKPFHLAELRARIDALLRLRRAERQVAERNNRLAAIEAVAEDGDGGVLDAIRSLARLGWVEAPVERQVTALPEWLDQVVLPLHQELWDAGVQVHLKDNSGGAAFARIDRAELASVLQSLIRNAGQAVAAAGTQDGIRHVFLTLDAATDVRIRVADDGPGTPLELAQRLFTPRRDRAELAQLRDAVRAQGGKLALEVQAPEGGAAFTIRLPASARQDEPIG